jgi:signal transduction histidine kinase
MADCDGQLLVGLAVADPARAARIMDRLASGGARADRVHAVVLADPAGWRRPAPAVPVDVVLLDVMAPGSDWLDPFSLVREFAADVPVVGVASHRDEAWAVEALRAGAQDYVLEPLPNGRVLCRVLRNARERYHLIRDRERAIAGRDRVVGMVSHDLRDPLTTMSHCAAALLDPRPTPLDGVRRIAEIIQRSAAWALDLVRDLLDGACLDGGRLVLHPERVRAEDIVESAAGLIHPVAVEHSVDFTVRCAGGLPPLYADRQRLVQALTNLLGNAMKFTPGGGRVSLKAWRKSTGPDRLPCEVGFSVADTGPGIPQDDLPHVFDWQWRPASASPGGSGLGLAIAKGLVEAHGGRMNVSSVEGRGSTFWFTIPARTFGNGT